MSEVLSQSQIDALLNAINNGDKDLGAEEPKSEEKKFRKYDFSSPKKFTKDRLKMLNGIFENYVRIVASRLNGILRMTCEMQVEAVEEQRYYEFSNAMTEGDVLTLAYDKLEEVGEKLPVLIQITTRSMLSMIDRLLGGEGQEEDDLPSDYTYTDMELRIYENIVQQMVSLMGEPWKNYLDLEFRFGKVETNPTLVQLMGLDETVVIIGISIQMPHGSGRLSICLPGTVLTSIFTQISRNSESGHVINEQNSEDIFETLRDSYLEVIADLGHTTLCLNDVYNLNVGDVINLERPKDSPVYLSIGGHCWFDGKMGIFEKNLAVQVENTYVGPGRKHGPNEDDDKGAEE